MDKFTSWIHEKGIITDVLVKETEYAGYGLFSKNAISSATTVVHIPDNLVLTSLKVIHMDETFSLAVYDYLMKKHNVDKPDDRLVSVHEKTVLCLFLLYCRSIETGYQPYIDMLPTLSFFKENHVLFNLDCIQGTSLEKSTRAKMAALQRDLHELQDLCASQHNWIADLSLEEYMWADCVFWSRVVGIGESEEASQANMALIPFFDFANHAGTRATVRWQLLPDQGGLDLVTYEDRPVQKGAELALDYGSKPNQELLFLHGFCIPSNPEPSCFTLSVLPFLNPANDPIHMPKMQWLKQIGATPTLTLVSTTAGKEHVDELDLSSCGWTHASIAMMYLVVLDEDCGLTFSVDEEGDMDGLVVAEKQVASLEELEKQVTGMDLLPVLKLRAVMLLLEALEYHYSAITQYSPELDLPVAKQALIYRQEEIGTLESAVEAMMELRDKLMDDPVVVSYLENMQ